MIPNPTPALFALLVLGVSAFVLIMFLPAFLELKKPRDAGPRRIMDEALLIPIVDLEGDYKLDQLSVNRTLAVLMALPNLEAYS